MGNENKKAITFEEIAQALANDYISLYIIDSKDDSYVEYLVEGKNKELVINSSGDNFYEAVIHNAKKMVYPEDQDFFLNSFKKENITRVLEDNTAFSINYRLMINGEPQYYFLKTIRGNDQNVIIGVRNVDEQKRRELDFNREMITYQHIAASLASRYEVIYYVNIDDNSYTQYSASDEYAKLGTAREGSDFFQDAEEDIKKFIYPDDVNWVLKGLRKENLLNQLKETGSATFKYRQLLGDKSRYVSMNVVIPKNDRKHIVMGVMNIDTQVRREMNLLAESEAFSDVVMALTSRYEVIYRVNIKTDEYLEYSSDDKYSQLKIGEKGRNFFAESQENMKHVIYSEDYPMMKQAMQKEHLLESLSASGKVYLNYRLMLDGRAQYATLIAVHAKEDSEHIVLAVENVDRAKRRELEFEKQIDNAMDMANKDSLTGVKNKHAYAMMEMKVDEQISNGTMEAFTVAVCDINGLKQVNDINGHSAGDEYIKNACAIICRTFQHSPVFRIGGDEFVVFMKGEDYQNRAALFDGFREKQIQNKQNGQVTLAYGYSDFNPSRDIRLQDVFERADDNMYDNKKRFKKYGKIGKSIAESIREAIEKRELHAYFQPQYDAITGDIICAESLVRWIKANGEIVPPIDFIPELEQTDAICMVDWYMLQEACETVATLREEGIKIPVSVNFSRWHVREKDYLEHLNRIVDSYNLPHKYIEIEITESALIIENELISDWVKRVRDDGYSVAIDDFGSGLSSLQFIKDVSCEVIKIDSTLLSGNCSNEKERAVLESIFYFAQRLNMKTVAEGVETIEQLGFLRTCNCVRIQGYFFAKPMPKEEYLKLCREKKNFYEPGDILQIQSPIAASKLLLDAVFMKYPLIIFANITRNSYYMMAYDNFTTTACPASGVFDELIEHGAATMHPDYREGFKTTFSRESILKAYQEGKPSISMLTRQLGDDGIYRDVEIIDYFVKSPSVDDVLIITLCDNR
ncbi:MAG: GGDEF domain-containing protein [Lachnospiraceae bacterium]|nr:GGDEF domain-containing protein [Lachnospiraceae bacterium]